MSQSSVDLVSVQQMLFARDRDRHHPAVHLELAVEVLQVEFHRGLAQPTEQERPAER